ncbi:MAG TPA: flagellar basal-body MS-ring/collar protein FliF [Alphaproteobacteria bacterium]|nr:flagellar basal-body MS-ring/collar protein FliF [Alphaproteobacteria bacterium]
MDSFLETLKNLGPARLIIMTLTLFGLIIFFIFITARGGAPSMTLLYGDLATSDATEIAAKLDNSRITYRLSEDGTQVSVSHKDVGRARMLLAQEGLPRSGSMGYEIFDQKESFGGGTSFRQNINQLRAMEGELSRTISTLTPIKSARVHLVLPQRELFSRESRQASASVFVNLRNTSINSEQIQAIQHLVAAAVPQLKSSHVAIIDQSGNLLARGEDGADGASTARTGEEMRTGYEQRVTRAIEDMVSRVVGYGKVRATVAAQLNFDIISRNSETYNPDGQVVRSTQTVTDENVDNAASSAAPVSVQTNLPGLPGNNGVTGSSSNRTEEVTNFEISKTTENVVRAGGQVERVSVAVVVDGRYEPDASAVKPEGAGADWTAPRVYVPRSQEELDKIATLVKSAVGYDEMRGDTVEVLNMQFAESDIFDAALENNLIMGFERAELISLAETLALAMVAVLAILAVFRPLISHFASAAKSAAQDAAHHGDDMPTMLPGGQMQAQLAGPAGMLPPGMDSGGLDSMVDMNAVEGKVKASSVQKISELVTSHPNETVSVIRQWMSQES